MSGSLKPLNFPYSPSVPTYQFPLAYDQFPRTMGDTGEGNIFYDHPVSSIGQSFSAIFARDETNCGKVTCDIKA